VHPIGTAVAVDCASKKVLLTAGHCCFSNSECTRQLKSNLFCTAWMNKRLDGSFEVTGECFPVSVVHATKKPDIGILTRIDGNIFDKRIPLCAHDDVPWIADKEGWECRVKCYHCPVDICVSSDMPGLGCNVTNYNAVAFHTNSHFAVTEEFLGGSSGGAMVLENVHSLLGILITTLVTNTTIDDVEVEEVDGSVSYTCSVTNPSVTYTTAIVPALVRVNRLGQNVPDFILSKGL
jgi:hypothetical protein